jgi:hypothetical protein
VQQFHFVHTLQPFLYVLNSILLNSFRTYRTIRHTHYIFSSSSSLLDNLFCFIKRRKFSANKDSDTFLYPLYFRYSSFIYSCSLPTVTISVFFIPFDIFCFITRRLIVTFVPFSCLLTLSVAAFSSSLDQRVQKIC